MKDWASEAAFPHRALYILLLGLALRVLWALIVPPVPTSDSVVYDQLAWNLASKGQYAWDAGNRTAYWPVGTSFVYSLLYRAFGHILAPIVWLNVAAGTATLALIMAVARRAIDASVALAAGVLYALWPSQIEFTTVLAAELLFNLCVVAALWATLSAPIRSIAVRGAAVGLLLAAAAYIRPQALLVAPILALALRWRRGEAWARIAAFLVAAGIVMALSVAPWAVRNTRLFGHPTLISTNGGPVMWMGNNPAADGTYLELPPEVANMNEAERATYLSGEARAFIRANPLRFVQLTGQRLIATHDRETIGVVWNDGLARRLPPRGLLLLKAGSTLYWLAVVALALAGALIVFARERCHALFHPALLLWGYFAAVHAITLGGDRYHMPSIPAIALLAGIALAALYRRALRPEASETP